MDRIAQIVARMRRNPADVRFAEALRVAEYHFGPPRINGSHHVFRMRWPGDPRVNLQSGPSGKAKAYQVTQLLRALDRLSASEGGET